MTERKDKIIIALIIINIISSGLILISSLCIKNNDDKEKSYSDLHNLEEILNFEKYDTSLNNSIYFRKLPTSSNDFNNTLEKISNIMSKTDKPLFFSGIFSFCFIFLLISSFCVKDKECNSYDISPLEDSYLEEAACCCGVCICCRCYLRCKRGYKKYCSSCSGCNGNSCNCNCTKEDCNCGGDKDSAIVCFIVIILIAFILFYLIAKCLGKNVSRLVSLIFLFFFDIMFICLAISTGTEDEMNGFCYMAILFGIIPGICNFLALLLPQLSVNVCIDLFRGGQMPMTSVASVSNVPNAPNFSNTPNLQIVPVVPAPNLINVQNAQNAPIYSKDPNMPDNVTYDPNLQYYSKEPNMPNNLINEPNQQYSTKEPNMPNIINIRNQENIPNY